MRVLRIKPEAVEYVLSRALQARDARPNGLPIRYGWGKGGYDPDAPHPADQKGLCDCSGHVAWCCHTTRRPKPGRPFWFNTDFVYHDATHAQNVFVTLPEPMAGGILVYPRYLARPGHMGLVYATAPSFDSHHVIDCASGPSRKYGHAITVRPADFFFKVRGRPAICVTFKEWLL